MKNIFKCRLEEKGLHLSGIDNRIIGLNKLQINI